MSEQKTNYLLVYGTLRPTNLERYSEFELVEQNIKIYNFKMYDLGSFPGIVDADDDSHIICDLLKVSDDELEGLDRYEGYYKEDIKNSIYIRIEIKINIGDNNSINAYIYMYNRSINGKTLIENGDWLSQIN